MPADDLTTFRRDAKAMVDLIADYLESIESRPVRSVSDPGSVRAALPPAPPQSPESFGAIVADIERIILPGLTHWQHPSFFGYFPANSSPPAILGELLSAGLGVQGMLWSTSPACTELETHMLDWLVPMLGLPEAFLSRGAGGGVIQDTASSSTLCALIAARDRATEWRASIGGVADGGPRMVAYASSQAHSSVEKAMAIAGLGRDNLRLIDVDGRFAMRADLLEAAIAADVAAGRRPIFCCATVGTTSSGAIDPVPTLAAICAKHRIWLHVDAAWAGPAALCPEHRAIHDGVELADSYCMNPHKWMLVNFDCDCMWVRDRAALVKSLSILPEYLRNRATESGAVIDYRDWHIPLGRRFRALKLWFTIRMYGIDGLREHIRRGVAMAEEFAALVRGDDRFELAVERSLALVCFRLRAGEPDPDRVNERLLERVNDTGRLFLTHTRLDGMYTLRMAIGGTWTRSEHVREAWRTIAGLA